MSTHTIGLTAKIAAEIFLGKIRLNPRQGEPSYLQDVRRVMLQLKKSLGNTNLVEFTEELRPTIHVIADLLFDEVTEIKRPETVADLKCLSVPQRVTTESLVARLTGKTDERGRWDDTLWRVHQSLRQMTELSVSDVTLADIRTGYHDLVHAIVDKIWDNRNTFVS